MNTKQIKLFTVITRYIASIEIINENRPAHVKFLDKYYKEGKIMLSGRQNPLTGGLIIIHSESREEAEKIMSDDPFYKNKLIEINIYEFEPMRFNSLINFANNLKI
jgi:uncharacterized protein YciI